MPTTLTARTLLTDTGTPVGKIDHPVITIADGKILSITSDPTSTATGTLTPCSFDIHIHGAMAHDLMESTPAEIDTVGRFLATKGVAHYLPTTVTAPLDATLRALDALATAIESTTPTDAARPLGIHLEGPFVSHAKRGVHPTEHLLDPSIALFGRLQQAARGHIRLLTLAPELPGALELIRHATTQGVRISLGHSNATAAETKTAIAAGATSATHTFNAMRALDHREPGILGTVLDTEILYAEAIVDGIHIDPAMVRFWLKAKGADHAILVTDGMAATGMPNGTYALGGLQVEVKDGVCLYNGTLAGSVLTMDRAISNLQKFTGAPLATAVRLASANPARMLGLDLSLTPGAPANFNVYDDSGTLTATWLNGKQNTRN